MVSKIFKRQLKRLDKTLFLKFDREKCRYIIYRKDRQNIPREILIIENNGEFCPPCYRHIELLYKADLWQNKNLIKEMDEETWRRFIAFCKIKNINVNEQLKEVLDEFLAKNLDKLLKGGKSK